MHCRVIVDEYAKEELVMVNPNHLEYEFDIPSPNGKKIIDNLIMEFILWEQRDIVLTLSPTRRLCLN